MNEYTLIKSLSDNYITESNTIQTRTQIINYLIHKYKFTSYLEIGIESTNINYDHIECNKKMGVDIRSETNPPFVGSSDDFFLQNKDTFDFIFIDGDHLCEQVDKDIENSLNVLNENGIIMCHDCLPELEIIQLRDWRPSSNLRLGWTGDVWKSISKLRMTRSDLKICVLNIDYGCCIIQRSNNEKLYSSNDENIYTWEYYTKHKVELLNVKNIEEINKL